MSGEFYVVPPMRPNDPRNPGLIIGEQTDQLGGVVNQDGLREDSQGNIVDDVQIIQPVITIAHPPPPVYNYEEETSQYINGNSGWNKGFFAGQEYMGESTRNVFSASYGDDNKHLNDIDNDLNANSNYSDLDAQNSADDSTHTAEQSAISTQMSETQNKMIFTDSSLDNISNENLQRPFADKENYEKYIQLKRDPRGVIGVYFKIVFASVMTLVLVGMVIWEVLIMMKRLDGDIRPNWGLVMLPIILMTLYTSYNSYSLIKILV